MKLKPLLKIQQEFTESLAVEVTIHDYLIALNVEVSEFINTLPWKWWKKQHEFNPDKVLEEIADVIAFWLSCYNLYIKDHVMNLRTLPESSRIEIRSSLIFKLEQGIERILNDTDPVKLVHLRYFDEYAMSNYEVMGMMLGRIMKLGMQHTGATIQDIERAYRRKMDVNYDRQKQNY